MAILYVTDSKSKLELDGNRILVRVGDNYTHQFPSLKLDKIVIFGKAEIETPVILHCLKEDIDMVFLSHRGKYYGRLEAPVSKNPELKILQYKTSIDESICLKFAKIFINGKITNMRVILQRHSDNSSPFMQGIKRLAEIKEDVNRAKELASLRGYEGSASRIYFSLFGKMIDANFTFDKRVRRPPTDPINSLLSFGYTLLFYDVYSAVGQVGLDPYLNLLHEVKYGRPSIALDLMEEYRPIIIDLLVLMLVNKKMIKPDDFYTGDDDGGVFISDKGRRTFIEQYERRLNQKIQYQNGRRRELLTYRRTIIKQAYLLIRAFKEEIGYNCVTIK